MEEQEFKEEDNPIYKKKHTYSTKYGRTSKTYRRNKHWKGKDTKSKYYDGYQDNLGFCMTCNTRHCFEPLISTNNKARCKQSKKQRDYYIRFLKE